MADAAPAQQWGKKSDVVENMKSKSGFEGEEEKLGQSIAVVLRMLGNHAGYDHEVNDPLVKAHLMAIDFAREKGTLAEYVAHDIEMMKPINDRMKNLVEKTGKKEIALVGLFDRTACHYALALDTTGEPGIRRPWQPEAVDKGAAGGVNPEEGVARVYAGTGGILSRVQVP